MASRKTRIRILYVEETLIWFELPGGGRFFAYPLPGSDFRNICSYDGSDFPQYVDAEFFIQSGKWDYDRSTWLIIDYESKFELKDEEWPAPFRQYLNYYSPDYGIQIETYVCGKIKEENEDIYILENEMLPVPICADWLSVHLGGFEDDAVYMGFLCIAIDKIAKNQKRESFSLETVANQYVKLKVDYDRYECDYEYFETFEFHSGEFLKIDKIVFSRWSPDGFLYWDVENKMNQNGEVGVKMQITERYDPPKLHVSCISPYDLHYYLKDSNKSLFVGVLKTENEKYYLEAMLGTYALDTPQNPCLETLVDKFVIVEGSNLIRMDFVKADLC